MGGAIHSWGGKTILEGFLKKGISRQGFEACIGVCVKWTPIAEDSEPVAEGTGIDAEPGKISDIGWALTDQYGEVSRRSIRKVPGLGRGGPEVS